jgi:hypothetical protein
MTSDELKWPLRRWAGTPLVTVTALVVATALGLTRTPDQHRAADQSAGHAAAALPAVRHPVIRADPVGALFTRPHGHLGTHFCTASVVSSPGRNLLITAAHCVSGVSLSPNGNLVFAPGYAKGRFSHGLWEVTAVFVDSRWAADHDPNDDVAFLKVTRSIGGSAASVQQAAGAERIKFDTPLPAPIRAVGYPDAADVPVACITRAVAFRPGSLNQVMFICPGFSDGTSGGPMLTDLRAARGTGAVIGVIGGYQQGGDSPSISYSSAFTAAIRSLYARAIRASRRGPA